MDERLREIERRSLADKSDAEALAELLSVKERGGEKASTARTLRGYIENTRKSAYTILGLKEEEVLKKEVLVFVENQIDPAILAAEEGFQPREGDAAIPDRESVSQAIVREFTVGHNGLTLEMAKARFEEVKKLHEVKLVLAPVTSVERYRQELQTASQIMKRSKNPIIRLPAENQLNIQAIESQVEDNQIKEWKFAITEGAQVFGIPEWDNGQVSLEERINRFNDRYASSRIRRLDLQSYIALMIDGLRHGKPIDCKYEGDSLERNAKTVVWQLTLFNEVENGLVIMAGWHDRERSVDLGHFPIVARSGTTRSRPSVIGVVR